MAQYFSPGVYVEEIPSAIQTIAGVGTSTAGFIGIFPEQVQIPVLNQYYNPLKEVGDEIDVVPRLEKLIGVTLAEAIGGAGANGNGAGGNGANGNGAGGNGGGAAPAVDAAVAKVAELKAAAEKAAADAKTAKDAADAADAKAKTSKAAADKAQADAEAADAAGKAAADAAAKAAKDAADADAAEAAQARTAAAAKAKEAKDAKDAAAAAAAAAPAAPAAPAAAGGAAPAGVAVAAPAAGAPAAAATAAGTAVATAIPPKGSVITTAAQAAAIIAAKSKTKNGITVLDPLKIENALTGEITFTTTGDVKLCTNFSDFRAAFGDFSTNVNQNRLAHAVRGFFNNGGTRCFVGRVTDVTQLPALLEKFGAIDEIALMAAPGLTGELTPIDPTALMNGAATDTTAEAPAGGAAGAAGAEGAEEEEAPATGAIVREALVTHCVNLKDRFAILDSDLKLAGDDFTQLARGGAAVPPDSDYAAFYFPWLKVFDPVTKMMHPKGNGQIDAPPSGHMAGIYARTDTMRGVFKAPANTQVMDALGLRYQVGKALQDGMNPHGVNCIRDFSGTIKVWGARTIGGDANGEWRYINVRRTFLFLRESIEEGMQWAVFEPNDLSLWAKITRNVTAFLTTQWRAGALFGATPADAFFVKCDAETNPPELREIGQVVTEIGVAVVRPAEFVIFRISQWQAPQKG